MNSLIREILDIMACNAINSPMTQDEAQVGQLGQNRIGKNQQQWNEWGNCFWA